MRKNIEIEICLLNTAIFEKYGYDFRDYAQASYLRRITNFIQMNNIKSVGELIHLILEDEALFINLLNSISVTVTEMFRDPEVYKVIRSLVIPYLKTYPSINIWHAGCATGQEVYSLAILLEEEEVKNYKIYATDINEKSLHVASEGIYSNEDIKLSTANYQKSGGKLEFSDYYHTKYDNSKFSKRLRKNITFMNHNLVTDESFQKFNFIICRNVLIYFNKKLQQKVLSLFNNSLLNNGFLCLGTKESLTLIDEFKVFHSVADKEKIFKKAVKK